MCQQPEANFGGCIGKDVKGKIIGLPREFFKVEGLDVKYKEAVESALHKLEKEGVILKEVSLPHIRYSMPSYCAIVNAEGAHSLAGFDSDGFGLEVKLRILLGNYVLGSDYYALAQKVRKLIEEDFKKAFYECDALAGPAMPGLPHLRGKCEEDHLSMVLSDSYTSGVNLAGLPGLVQPCGKIDGVPVGIQWIGKPLDEASLLLLGDAAERIF
jgi:aspartyl-tRNA(Asn)/glutamyl-tRNA(Gln) amidotransferase subunit A